MHLAGKITSPSASKARQDGVVARIKGGEFVVVAVKEQDRHIGAFVRLSFRRYATEQNEGNP